MEEAALHAIQKVLPAPMISHSQAQRSSLRHPADRRSNILPRFLKIQGSRYFEFARENLLNMPCASCPDDSPEASIVWDEIIFNWSLRAPRKTLVGSDFFKIDFLPLAVYGGL